MAVADPYYVRGLTAATAATADHCIAELWSPGTVSGRRIQVVEIHIFKTAAGTGGDGIYIARTSARGTAGSTVTPSASNAGENDSAPPSGAVVDLSAFSVQPTRQSAPYLDGWVAPAVAGAGIILPYPRGIIVPAGTGLGIFQRAATAWPISEVAFVFED